MNQILQKRDYINSNFKGRFCQGMITCFARNLSWLLWIWYFLPA